MPTDSARTPRIMLAEAELTYHIRGALIEVSRRYGPRHKERVYQQACAETFGRFGLSFVAQPRMDICSLDTGRAIAVYVPDFLVEERVVVELKAVPVLLGQAIAQLEQYLRASAYEIGILVNFGTPRAQIVRRVYTNDRKSWISLVPSKAAGPSI